MHGLKVSDSTNSEKFATGIGFKIKLDKPLPMLSNNLDNREETHWHDTILLKFSSTEKYDLRAHLKDIQKRFIQMKARQMVDSFSEMIELFCKYDTYFSDTFYRQTNMPG